MKTESGISTGQIAEYPELKPKAGFYQPPRSIFMLARRASDLGWIVNYILSEQQWETPRREFVPIPFDAFLMLTGEGERSMEKKLAKAEALKLIRREHPGRRFIKDRGGYQVNVSVESMQAIPVHSRRKGWHVCREAALVARSAIAACKLEKANFSSPKLDAPESPAVIAQLLPDDVIFTEAEKRKAYLSPVPEKSELAAETNLSSLDVEAPKNQLVNDEIMTGTNFYSLVADANFNPAEYEVECPQGGWHHIKRIRKNPITLARETEALANETPAQRHASIRKHLTALQEGLRKPWGEPDDNTVENFAKVDPHMHGPDIADFLRKQFLFDNQNIKNWGGVLILYREKHKGNT